ncbi:hypothetical protein D9615_003027 [Tricholomella constricta]|uniref:Uncharacterized protein n=1 Tax=Tricholomella constricta TaxID=117010 RepID=A0A8H5HFS6_9AGAR|nr:hypothetical protein D9615_003027 [Tricholomella constricta]
MSSWRNQQSRPAHRGRGRAAPRGPQPSGPPKKQIQMEHIASVSRSSGIEKDGDTLKDWKVQEEYRVFLQGKVDDVLNKYPRRATESEKETNQRINAQENVLILFRKLREGISATRRCDSFALEVYETSLYLAAAFESPKQSTSIIPHLVPSLYVSSPAPHDNLLASVVISLLHHLVVAYPSQSSFRQHFASIPSGLIPRNSAASKWIVSLAKSLRTQNYAAFELSTRPSSISRLFEGFNDLSSALKSMSISSGEGGSLSRQALSGLVHSLRSKARETTWEIIRSAYREVSCTNEETQTWLGSSLCLQSVVPYGRGIGAEDWLEQQSMHGHTRHKDGVVGRWIIYKAR